MPPAPVRTWPFVGRAAELRSVLDAVAEPACGGVMLLGEGGVGKTRLADAALAALAAAGRDTVRVIASPAMRLVPLGAVAQVLPPAVVDEAGDHLDALRLFDAVRDAIRRAPSGDRVVALVDDLPLLDDASLTLLGQLLGAGLVMVLGTARHGAPFSATLASLERAHQLRRIEVRGLDRDDVSLLLEQALDGPVEPATAGRLWQVSGGNALYLRELVLGGLESGALAADEGGVWRAAASVTAAERLLALVSERLAGIEGAARDVIELLAVAEPLTVDDLERAGLLDAATELEAAGSLTVTDEGPATVVRLVHPLYREVLRAALPDDRRRLLLLEAAHLVTVRPRGRPDDALRIASWQLEAGTPADPEVLLDGARLARAGRDFLLTERLARAAHHATGRFDALLALEEALYELGRFDESDELLGQAAAQAPDDLARLQVALAHHRTRLWGLLDPDGSLAGLDEARATIAEPLFHEGLLAARATVLAFDGRPAAALDVVDAMTTDLPLLRLSADVPRATALTLVGRPAEARQVAARAFDEQVALGDAAGFLPDASLHRVTGGLALTELGRYDEAEALLRDGYLAAVDGHVPLLQGWSTLSLGRAALFRGRLGTARRWFGEALVVATDLRFAPIRRMAITGLAACAGQLGEAGAARELLDDLLALPADLGFLAPERALGLGWARAVTGELDRAVAALLAGADEAVERGQPLLALELWHEAGRLNPPPAIRAALAAAVAALDPAVLASPLAAARAARLTCGDDPEHLAAAEAAFTALGAVLPAAEVAAELATALHGQGAEQPAVAAAGRSRALAARCEGAATPLLRFHDGVQQLSAREREIAGLAAAGLTSKQIAAELGLSVRTVSNHLQNAYAKLGVSGRAGLARALGQS